MAWDDGPYLAWITALTVGYGALTPKTTVARLLGIAQALTGVIFTAVITSLALTPVASRLSAIKHSGNAGYAWAIFDPLPVIGASC
ncbi:MAG: two pore domain potassium channel family protein [Gammaproteobacteria bacterium]|nr:two pore domain potassium channel family protein [Gammaproteobacteria bacterium]